MSSGLTSYGFFKSNYAVMYHNQWEGKVTRTLRHTGEKVQAAS